jgi:hypothetical protein
LSGCRWSKQQSQRTQVEGETIGLLLVVEGMEIVVESQPTWSSLLLLTGLFVTGLQFIFFATTIIVGSFRFFLAWNQIVRLNRPTSLLQAAVNTFVYRRCPKMKQEPSDECPICLAEYGQFNRD